MPLFTGSFSYRYALGAPVIETEIPGVFTAKISANGSTTFVAPTAVTFSSSYSSDGSTTFVAPTAVTFSSSYSSDGSTTFVAPTSVIFSSTINVL